MRSVSVVLCLIGLISPVCSAAEFRVPVERNAPYPLSLPAPGPATQAPLPPRAEAAKQKGLSAARTQDWKTAAGAFKEALDYASCAPSLVFNLALAYDRGAKGTLAALWYRAYLAQLPDAPNAAAVRAEVTRIASRAETVVQRIFDESEKLAAKLSALSVGQGTKSQQQQALERIAWQAYYAGLLERGAKLVAKIQALPGAQPLGPELKDAQSQGGLWGAYVAGDLQRARAIQSQWGRQMDPGFLGLMMAGVLALHGDIAEAEKWANSVTAKTLAKDARREIVTGELSRAGAYESAASMYARALEGSTEFDEGLLFWTNLQIEDALWDGRPDVALDLAHKARRYVERFATQSQSDSVRQDFLNTLAILGDRSAIEASLQGPRPLKTDDFRSPVDVLSRVAMALATNQTPTAAVTTIDRLVAYWNSAYKRPATELPYFFPLAFFVRAVLSGQSAASVNILDAAVKWDAKLSYIYTLALRFAVSTGRDELALVLADRVPGRTGLMNLNRIGLRPSTTPKTRGRIDAYAAAVCEGWRPLSVAHAKSVSRWLWLANLKSDTSDDPLTESVDWAAKNSPESLPDSLASEGASLYIRTIAIRAQE